MKTKILIPQLLCILILCFWSNLQAIDTSGVNEFDDGIAICDAGEISFDDFFFSTREVCLSELPSTMEINRENDAINDTYNYVLTTSNDLILNVSEIAFLETGDLEIGTYRVYGVSFNGSLNDFSPGHNLFNVTSSFCFEVSDYLQIIVENCDPDCPESGMNYGDPCDDGNPNTISDQIGDDCECAGNLVVVCFVQAEGIVFEGGGTSRETCYNNSEPAYYNYNDAEIPYQGPDMYFVITDPAGNFVATATSAPLLNTINFNLFGAGAHFIQVLRYDAETSNADELLLSYTEGEAEVNLSDLDGCFDLSNTLEVIGIACASEFDCHELMVNIGDPCDDMNPLTENDIINSECECEGELIQVYNCEELMANIGDLCDDLNPGTEYDIISNECECIGLPSADCDITPGVIEFYNPETPELELGTTQNFCATDAVPSYTYVRYQSGSSAPNPYFLVCDQLGNVLEIPTSLGAANTLDFDQFGTNTVIIHTVHFYAMHSNLSDLRIEFLNGAAVNLSDFEGCFALSSPLETIGMECDSEFDCPELEANIGDSCDDGNPETENDMISPECNCVGSPPFECDADATSIGFYDPAIDDSDLGETFHICATDGEPSYAYIQFNSFPSGPNMHFIISDLEGNYLDVASGFGPPNTYDFDQFGLGQVYIQAVRYYGEHSNAQDLRLDFLINGTPTNLSDLDGCFDLSNQVQLIGLDCTELPECPELEANIGDSCDDLNPETENDIVTEVCMCEGEEPFICDATGATISLYDPEVEGSNLGETIDICATDGEPSNVFVQFSVFQLAPNLHYIITDEFGNYLNILNTDFHLDAHDFDQYGIGEVYIQVVAYYFAHSNANDLRIAFVNNGLPTNLSQLEGCFDLSNQIQVTGLECEDLPECPELEANIGDSCDDLNAETENDIVTEECMCEGTDTFDCDAAGAIISFYDPEVEESNLGESVNNCIDDQEPGNVYVQFDVMPTGPNLYYVIVDGLENYLGVETSLFGLNVHDFDQYGEGEVFIQVISYYPFESNANALRVNFSNDGLAVNLSDLEGCFALSNPLTVVGIECLILTDCPNLGLDIGAPCDDQDENTENDMVDEECQCAGTVIDDCDVEAIGIIFSDLTYESTFCATDGIPSTININIVYLPTILDHYFIVHDEAGNFLHIASDTDVIQLMDFDPFGLNTVYIQWVNFDASQSNADELETQFLAAESVPNISDLEGCYALSGELEVEGINCDPDYCEELEANVGDACDDNNADTENDTINENCICEGDPIITYDCPLLEANIGDACDDGNPLTTDDFVGPACECIGIPIVFDCPILGLNVGDVCDDGNPATINDTVNINCECQGEPVIFDCTFLFANIGDPCDDENPLTSNDVITETCECEGIPEIVVDCPELGLNVGDACDDGDPLTSNDTVNENCGCSGIPELVDCPDLLGNVGDVCPLGDAAGVIDENCECVPDDGGDCEEWVMYLNDNHDGQTDIYGVDISSGDAVMTYITTVLFQGHIAYNSDNNLIYVIHNGNGSYVTVDPNAIVPVVSAPVFLSENVPSVTTAAFAPNGKLIIGSFTEKIIYSVDVTTNVVSLWDSYAPIVGGDIAFDLDGMLYLATRAGNGFYEVYPEDVMPDLFIANIPSLVTGMALTEDGMLITSHNGNANLQLMGTNGINAGVDFPLVLDGIPFAHGDGDMTSGCVTDQNDEEECEEFYTFYIHQGPGVEGAKLYNVEFDGTDANLDLMLEIDFPAHIGFDPINGLVFLVNPNGAFIQVYDPYFDEVLGDLPIDGDLSSLVAVAYNVEDELLYVGDSNTSTIHTIDPTTGMATYFADAPVLGGDLVFHNGELYLATRQGDKLYQMAGGVAVEISSIETNVNGMAVANNATDVVIANYESDVFTQLNISDGAVVTTYNVLVDGSPLTTLNGDFASGCPGDYDNGEGGTGVFFYGSGSDSNFLKSAIRLYPNPTAGNTEIVFSTGITGIAKVELFDMQGKPSATLFNEEVKAGEQIKINFDARNYSDGLYLINLTTTDESITEKIIIAK